MEYPPTPPAEYEKNAKFFLNPLECLLPSESVTTGSEFVKPGTPAAMMIRRITNNILTYETSAMSRTRAYSPSFRCNTGLPFYASLLRELKSLVNEIDYQPSSIRGIVWAQLFTIVGTQQHYDGLFGPVLRDTMSQTTVNLLDIEVLLISFFLIINRYPQILDGDMTDVPLEPSEGQSLELERQAQRFFSQFRTRPAFISPPPVRSHGMTDLVQRARAVHMSDWLRLTCFRYKTGLRRFPTFPTKLRCRFGINARAIVAWLLMPTILLAHKPCVW